MTANLVWSIALAAVGILGIYLAGRKNLWGWAVGLGAQVLWLVFGLVTGQYGFILSAVAYGVVYGRNWLSWRREGRDKNVTITETLEERLESDGKLWRRAYSEGLRAQRSGPA